uniref:Uncharacterized protein n=1 Tax=Clastoptera arizonana TaxID=38151 RepID=A0A1B6DMG5_9HEMI
MKLLKPENSDHSFNGNQSNMKEKSSPLKGRKLIKVDFSVICDDDDDDDMDEDYPQKLPLDSIDSKGNCLETPKTRPNPWHRTGTLSNTGPLTREEYHHYCDTTLECTLPPQKACRVISCHIL